MFLRRVSAIASQHKWVIEKYVLGFFRCYPMPFPYLARIPFVPQKSQTVFERIPAHLLYISHIYEYVLQARRACSRKIQSFWMHLTPAASALATASSCCTPSCSHR